MKREIGVYVGRLGALLFGLGILLLIFIGNDFLFYDIKAESIIMIGVILFLIAAFGRKLAIILFLASLWFLFTADSSGQEENTNRLAEICFTGAIIGYLLGIKDDSNSSKSSSGNSQNVLLSKKTCSQCHGSGEQIDKVFLGNKYEDRYRTCTRCNGQGRI